MKTLAHRGPLAQGFRRARRQREHLLMSTARLLLIQQRAPQRAATAQFKASRHARQVPATSHNTNFASASCALTHATLNASSMCRTELAPARRTRSPRRSNCWATPSSSTSASSHHLHPHYLHPCIWTRLTFQPLAHLCTLPTASSGSCGAHPCQLISAGICVMRKRHDTSHHQQLSIIHGHCISASSFLSAAPGSICHIIEHKRTPSSRRP